MSGTARPGAFAAMGDWRPYVGILGVLLGSMISTLSGRVTTFGLADIRGAIHAGVDEGAWITTAFTTAQMLVAIPAIWLGAVLGPRRVLLAGASAALVAFAVLPLTDNLAGLLIWQTVAGLGTGTFIPLTIGYVMRNLPARLKVYGIAAYGMSLELSLSVAASLEGYYSEYWSWRWIFWQDAILAIPMLACIWLGMPSQPVNQEAARNADLPGLIYPSLGFAMLYAAIDQGNRLDWTGSGLIVGLLLGGALLVGAFIVNEITADNPAVNVRFLALPNIGLLACLLVLYRFASLSTAYVIPQFLTTVRGFRSLETGDVLLVIAIPQFIIAPILAVVLGRFDARPAMAFGFFLIGLAGVLCTGLTHDWGSDAFLSTQVLQAIGQSTGLTALVWFAVRHLRPADAFTFGAMLQTSRLLGGELGIGAMQTFVRVREQVQDNLLGLHVTAGSSLAAERLAAYANAIASRSVGNAQSRATALLAQSIQREAYVLAFADAFALTAFAILLALLLMLLLRRAPETA